LLTLNALLLTLANTCLAETQTDDKSGEQQEAPPMMEADHSVAMAIGGATLLMILITVYQHNGRA